MKSAVGIDIGGTHVRAARVDARGAILERRKLVSHRDPPAALERIEALIAELDEPSVAGIGIGVPGRVDSEARRVLSGGYVDLSGTDLVERLEARFARPVVIDNDCSMALLGEAASGAARGQSDVVMLTIGTGIGGASLERGRLLRGRASAGQFGHVTVVPGGLPCTCGRRGCVETTSSGTAFGRLVTEAGLAPGTTAAALLARRAAGDTQAAALLHAWAAPLRLAAENLVALLDPALVLLGGGLGHAAFEALGGVEEQTSWFGARLAPAALGDDAGVIGAALAALPRAAAKRLVLVNGVPASGKSGVARKLSRAAGWPVLSLDTIKEPFLAEIGDVDRPFNRRLGRASLRAMFALAAAVPPGATLILDAWFGFQTRAFVEELIAASGAGQIAEIWCAAPPEVIGARYGARAASRPAGHPGMDYVPELVSLAARAEPLGPAPIRVDTTEPLDISALLRSVEDALGRDLRFDASPSAIV